MIKTLTFILLIVCALSGFSQTSSVQDDKYKFVASFDMRNSVVIGHSVKFNGVKLGLGNSKQRFGIGFYGLRTPVHTYNNRVREMDATDTNRYSFGFLSFYYERIFFSSKRWEITTPLHLNFGSLKGEYLNMEQKYVQFVEKGIVATTLSIKSHFKIFRWVGLQGGVGYNLIINGDKRTQKALNAPFYSFGVKIFLGELWKMTTNKEYRKSDWEE
mgnify:CR=1 FL=1